VHAARLRHFIDIGACPLDGVCGCAVSADVTTCLTAQLAFDFRPVGSGCDAGKTLVLVILVTQVLLLVVPLLLVTVVIAVACVVAIASATHHRPCDGPGDGDGVADPTAPPSNWVCRPQDAT
jgi:hypothetical protein